MTREMIINANLRENVRVAILKDGLLWDYFEDSQAAQRTRGNIYLGRISHVQPALGACFVEYGEPRQGLLPMDELLPGAMIEPPAAEGNGRPRPRPGQRLIVQVDKEPVDQKGARLTCNISLAGRHLVLTPFSQHRGVSRKIEDQQERERTRQLAQQLSAPSDMGLIVRTVAVGQSPKPLRQDLEYLLRLWREIVSHARRQERPGLLHGEVELLQRLLRDYYSNDIDAVWVDEAWALESARQFFKIFAPRQINRLRAYQDKIPIFTRFGVDEQLELAFSRRVSLPSGGGLVIEPTEALVAIDVNSGKVAESNAEQTALATNLEAATEVARQLRLRNLGGIVVIDFIDMERNENQRRVEQRLREALKDDKAHHRLGKISSFGLCVLTRQRLEQPLRAIGQRPCATCGGSGVVRSIESLSLSLLRRLESLCGQAVAKVTVKLPCELANYFQGHYRQRLAELEREKRVSLEILAEPGRQPQDIEVSFEPPPNAAAESARAANEPAVACASQAPAMAPKLVASAPATRRRRRHQRRKKKIRKVASSDPTPSPPNSG